MNSLRLLLIVISLVCLCGCASAPEKSYSSDEYQRLSTMWFNQADKKRAQRDYPAAIALYRKAQKYALKRNDLSTIGLARLKRAAIHLQLNELEMAERLLVKVEQMNQFEQAGLENAVSFIRARQHYHLGEIEQAVVLLQQLEAFFAPMSERNIYYRLVRWSYRPETVALATIKADLAILNELVAERRLSNIEIYSFALYHYAKYLTAHADSAAEGAIKQAIAHFSSLELSAKIRDCFALAVVYYHHQEQVQKVAYYEAKIKALDALSKAPVQ